MFGEVSASGAKQRHHFVRRRCWVRVAEGDGYGMRYTDTDERDAAEAVSVQHAGLPEVEHDQDNSRFVVRLSSLQAGKAGTAGDEGGSKGEGRGDDEALLAYVMRKRKGAKVCCQSLRWQLFLLQLCTLDHLRPCV